LQARLIDQEGLESCSNWARVHCTLAILGSGTWTEAVERQRWEALTLSPKIDCCGTRGLGLRHTEEQAASKVAHCTDWENGSRALQKG
jgi:hypothetical protein